MSRETPPAAFPLEDDLEKDRRVVGAPCELAAPSKKNQKYFVDKLKVITCFCINIFRIKVVHQLE